MQQESEYIERPLSLNELSGQLNKKRKRIGRGIGSGSGKTSGKGHKGQRSRAGARRSNVFQGGQMPLERRLPKRGFVNINRIDYQIINLNQINYLCEQKIVDNQNIKLDDLLRIKMIHSSQKLKILSNGEITSSINIEAHKISDAAREKIEKMGGKINLIES